MASWLDFDLVSLNKALILKISLLGSLEEAQIYLSGWVGGVTMILRQSQFNLTSIGLLELSLAIMGRGE